MQLTEIVYSDVQMYFSWRCIFTWASDELLTINTPAPGGVIGPKKKNKIYFLNN